MWCWVVQIKGAITKGQNINVVSLLGKKGQYSPQGRLVVAYCEYHGSGSETLKITSQLRLATRLLVNWQKKKSVASMLCNHLTLLYCVHYVESRFASWAGCV